MSIEPLTPTSSKFNTCKFRSEEPVTQKTKGCSCKGGGEYLITAYVCHKREIFQVTDEICQECTVYESK
jgi:hypothetical protein